MLPVAFPTKNLLFEATMSMRWIGLSLLYALIVKGPDAPTGDNEELAPALAPFESVL